MKSIFCILFVLASAEAVIKNVAWTMYNLAKETDFPIGSSIKLKSCDGKTTFASVGKQFAESLRLEGSGLLKDGKTYLNLDSCCEGCEGSSCGYNCFMKTNGPLGSQDNPLQPFISFAAKDIKYSTKIFVTELKGFKLPTGQIHNGCVSVDDTCGTCTEHNWLDFYVASKTNLEWIQNHDGFETANIEYPSTCTLGQYKAE